MQEDETLVERLPYVVQLGLNISLARKHIANPPLTQGELAMRLNRSQNYISKVERGISNPTLTELELMAQVFGVTVLELKPRFKRHRYL